MNKNFRHRQLLSLLNKKKHLSISQITQFLEISPATARRDVSELDSEGLLKKVRNGAELISQKSKSHEIFKQFSDDDEKRRIAERAADFCTEGESVFLTCGSTMLMLANSLCRRNIQIITNYLPLANHVIENDHENVVIMGGQYNKNQAITLSISSHSDSLYAANTMFTSGMGITTDGLYKNDMLIAHSEQRMLGMVSRLIVLMDSSKLGKAVGMLFTDLSNIDLLITGKEADQTFINALKQKGLKVVLV